MGDEKLVENSIKEYLSRVGGYIVKCQSGKVFQTFKGKTRAIHMAPVGTPDLLACFKGRFLAIEVKKDEKEKEKWECYPLGLTGRPVKYNKRTEKQKQRRDEVVRAGGLFVLACSIDDVERALIDNGLIANTGRMF